jgi:hypothetical protein
MTGSKLQELSEFIRDHMVTKSNLANFARAGLAEVLKQGGKD